MRVYRVHRVVKSMFEKLRLIFNREFCEENLTAWCPLAEGSNMTGGHYVYLAYQSHETQENTKFSNALHYVSVLGK